MKHLFAVTALTFFAAQGCKKDEDKSSSLPQGTFAEQTYYLLETGTLENSGSLLKGSGALVFASALDGIDSDDNFALEFSIAEGGSLALVTHADSSLANGLTVQFERSGSELISLLKADGSGTEDHKLEGFDAKGPISLSVDVHNGESPAHVLIFADDQVIYNSEEVGDSPGKGKGSFWGLVLRDAEVKAVSRDEPKFSDE